jgi:hypothetical protein
MENNKFDLEALENFLCPKCRRKLSWTETVCPYCENAKKKPSYPKFEEAC